MTCDDKYLVSTDLDGTLLDHHNYDWQPASSAIRYLSEHNIPLIFNTSKTLAEAIYLQHIIGISGPVIIENGSALAIPRTEKALLATISDSEIIATRDHFIIEFGRRRDEILDFISAQKEKHGKVLDGYKDWDLDLISKKTGLTPAQAKLSIQKNYSEPFIWQSSEEKLDTFIQQAELAGLKVMKGGRFFHIQGNTTKAIPILWLKERLEAINSPQKYTLVCLGDNHNDIHMLNAADIPVCVRSPTADFPPIKENDRSIYTENFGPKGWQEAMQIIFPKQRMS